MKYSSFDTEFLYPISYPYILSAEVNTKVRLPIRDAHGGHKGWLHIGNASNTETWRTARSADAWHIGHVGHMGANGTQIGVG